MRESNSPPEYLCAFLYPQNGIKFTKSSDSQSIAHAANVRLNPNLMRTSNFFTLLADSHGLTYAFFDLLDVKSEPTEPLYRYRGAHYDPHDTCVEVFVLQDMENGTLYLLDKDRMPIRTYL